MTKEQIMDHFSFNNNDEKQEAVFYLDMKGIAYHKKIGIHLGLDFDKDNQTVEWKSVSSLLRYDKRLRDKIYIYLATLEEYIRAYIGNKYDDYSRQEFWINGRSKRTQIKKRISNGERVSCVLAEIDFGDLIGQVLSLPKNDIDELFDNLDNINLNLNAVRVLRNAVSHHAFLLDYNFKQCIVNNEKKNSLEHNIKNLRQLLPMAYQYGKNGKGGITKDIENCQFEYQVENNRHVKKKLKLNIRDIIIM